MRIWCNTERTKDWMRLLPVIFLMTNCRESWTTGYLPHELSMAHPAWFLHAPYPEDSYSTVSRWVKEQQDKVDKAKAMLQRVKQRQLNKKNKQRTLPPIKRETRCWCTIVGYPPGLAPPAMAPTFSLTRSCLLMVTASHCGVLPD